MKRLLFYLILAALLFCTTDSFSINISNRAKCDTLIMRGSYSQLKQLEAVALGQLEKKPTTAMKGYLYALLGDIQVALGNYKGGLEWYRKGEKAYSMVNYSKEGNDEMYYYMQCLYNYANLQVGMGGEYQGIMDKCTKSLELISKWAPYALDYISEDKVYAKIMYSSFQIDQFLCWIDFLARKFPLAIEALEKNLKELEDNLFKHDIPCNLEYAQTLGLIADMYERSSNYEEAITYFQKSLEYIKKACGEKSTHYAKVLGRIGSIYYTLNDLDQAEDYFKASIAIFEDRGFKEHAELAVVYSGIGMIKLNRHNLEKSQEYFSHAYQIQEKMCGKDSFMAVLAKLYIAYPLMMQGDYKGATKIAEEVLQNETMMGYISSDHFANTLIASVEILLMTQSYNQVINLHKDIEELLLSCENISLYPLRNYYLNIGRAYKRSGDYVNAIVQFNKMLEKQRTIAHDNFSFLTEEQRSNLWAVDESRIKSLFAVNRVQHRNAPTAGGMLYDVALLNKGILLQASINLAEVIAASGDDDLKQKFTDFRLHMQGQNIKEQGITRKIQEMESEIVKRAKQYGDFMEYTNFTWQDVQTALEEDDVAIEFVSSTYLGECTYSAEIIMKGMPSPKHVKLFTISERKISSLHAEPGKFSSLVKEKIWNDEILQMLNNRGNIYFVPTGELYNIGIEYIPLKNGKLMCDVYNMHRLSSTREIVNKSKPLETNTCALYGGLNYNTSLSDMELYAYATSMRGTKSFSFSPDRSSNYTSWGYLPGTVEEVNSISETLDGNGYDVTAFTGSEGVEETFKALSGQKTKIIHIATHGFYLPDKGDALQNSGLVFAGANNFWNVPSQKREESFDDGILTAREISHLNLQGTDLVVMSACQTGLGEVTGEGVFGLQRAFKKAGVQTLLMSLWEVDDEATQLMMSEFYHILAQGKTKRQALESAQAKVRSHTFVRNGKEVSGNDPYYWGAFIMMD